MSQPTPEKPDILRVFQAVGYEVPLSPRESGWTKIRCPLHDDRTPSASVNIEINRWQCFTCSLNEDSFDVLMRERGISLGQARIAAETEFGSSPSVRTVHRNGGAISSRKLWD